MEPVLVAYATTEGQTRKIAQFIADWIRVAGYEVDLLDTTSADAAVLSPIYVGAVLGASVHAERYQSSFVHFVKSNGVWLQGISTAVFSVSLAAASNDENVRHEARDLTQHPWCLAVHPVQFF